MRFFGIDTKNDISEEKLKVYISVSVITLIVIILIISASAYLNWQVKQDKLDKAAELAAILEQTTTTAVPETTPEISPSESDVTTATDVTSETSTTASVSETTTAQTSETTSALSESEYYCTVYATEALNLRSGPGTEYSLVRQLNSGDAIDVVAQTNNGWYRTYNGNYVLASLTTTVAPATPTARPTPVPPTATPVPAAGTETYYGSCTITFYGPQTNSDGSISTTTATGTTCTQGRTCAADWGVFPAGTVIHVVNDPLGGDGYYTVEDRGPGVNGSHIDIYADDPYAFSTTSAEVYVVH